MMVKRDVNSPVSTADANGSGIMPVIDGLLVICKRERVPYGWVLLDVPPRECHKSAGRCRSWRVKCSIL